jgi:hypothetical protein
VVAVVLPMTVLWLLFPPATITVPTMFGCGCDIDCKDDGSLGLRI